MTILTTAPAHYAPPATAAELADLMERLVAQWHTVEPAHAHEGLAGRVCDNHRFNFLLWHEEDIARSPDVTDPHRRSQAGDRRLQPGPQRRDREDRRLARGRTGRPRD